MRQPFTLISAAASALILALTAPGLARAATCASPAQHSGGEWPMLNGPVTGTRHQAAEHVIGPQNAALLVPKWTFSIFGDGTGSGIFQSSATVGDGCVYVGTSTGWVFALNAETGELVWKNHGPEDPGATGSGASVPISGAGVFAVAIEEGRVIAGFSGTERRVRAFDQFTGAILWTSEALGPNEGEGNTITASPVVFNGMVWVTLATEVNPESRVPYYLLSTATGQIVHKDYVIPEKDIPYGYGGGGIWSTAAVDVADGYLYAATSDSETYTKQHRYNNAMLKIDVNPARAATFGKVVDAYKGVVDTYIAGTDRTPVCQATGNEVGALFRGGEYSPSCGEVDIDFGASINLFVDEEGDKVVTAMQKACVFHAVTTDTMTQKWTAILSHPDEVGCYATAAVGDGKIFAPSDQPAVVWAMTSIGYPSWVQSNNVIASGPPISYANGVVYTADSYGLVAWDAATGVPLLYRPFSADVGEFCGATAGGVSIARNMLFVECDWSPTNGGWIIAYALPPVVGDADAIPDALDNCPYAANPLQEDDGGINTATPDGIGNACQCGDVSGNGIVNGQDANAIKRHGLGQEPNPLYQVPGLCDVTGNGSCNGQDGNAVNRAALGIEPNPLFGQHCQNADPNAPPCTNC